MALKPHSRPTQKGASQDSKPGGGRRMPGRGSKLESDKNQGRTPPGPGPFRNGGVMKSPL